NKARLVEKIAELVNEKKITGISRLRDESDRKGMRVVIELKRDAVSDVVINQLLKLTPLQRTFGVNMLAIVNGVPKVLSLKETLAEFLDHRRSVVTRRTRFELAKARARLHILEGYRIALDHIDEVIALIRSSDSTAEAKEGLMSKFGLSDIQAQNILDMPLKRLTGLERKAIEDEYLEVLKRIEELTKILSSKAEVDKVVGGELRELGEKFNDPRRTEIEPDDEEIDLEDMIAEEDMAVSISHRGYAKRISPSTYRAQRRGGKGIMGTKKLSDGDEDFVSELFVASTHAYLLVFTTKGRLHWIKVYNLPEAGRTARGRAIVNMLSLGEEEQVSAIMPVRHFEENKYVVMVTRRGYIKRVDLMAFSNVRRAGLIATTLDEGDELIGARLTEGSSDLIISAKSGVCIRFDENDVRPMGRAARGVRAMSLDDGDEVVNVVAVEKQELEDPESAYTLLTVCENGFGKRTSLTEYRKQGRGGKGIIDIKTNERNGSVIGTSLVHERDDVMLITTAGKVIRFKVGGISRIGRNTLGVNLVTLDEGEVVAAVARLAE
ncbi:MAG: DNA gyrase subunit A, partial [Bdellovibrionales bacterium]|nr:DNA gyrase subunit A [Bdellovibrionales bacterium]